MNAPALPPSRFGRLVGVSLGPGDPDLITRRGWRALQSGARWAYPVKRAEEASYALVIACRGGLDVPHDAVELVFPMTRDAVALAKAWARAAAQTMQLLAEGSDVAFLVEGDASTYSTFRHLARAVRELAPEVEVETIPGVTVVESGQPCCGIAGTYGLKKEKFEIAQKVGKPLFDMIKATNPKLATCETETCRWQIRKGTNAEVIHPIELVHAALGLSPVPAGASVSG